MASVEQNIETAPSGDDQLLAAGMLTRTPATDFNVGNYLAERAVNPSLVMVEIGHDSLPVAYQQPFDFKGGRAYIGVEAWLRDPINVKRNRLAELRAQENGTENIFYISQSLGGETHRENDDWPLSYRGDYETTCLLPDKAADEILVSNVFCDPLIAFVPDRTDALLSEVSRLLANDGVAVFREALTPQYVYLLTDETLAANGLHAEARVRRAERKLWRQLDEVYRGEPSHLGSGGQQSYYLFLSKATA